MHRTDHRLGRLASKQHGRVARWQLYKLGLTSSEIDARVARGNLIVVHRGVYAVGNAAPSRLADLIAAVLAHGPHAALGFASAAELHRIADRVDGPIHVVVRPGRRPRGRRGIRTHRPRALAPDEVTVVNGIRCTTVARTLADLAPTRTRWQLQRMANRAEARGLLDRAAVVRACRGGVRGQDVLRDVLFAGDRRQLDGALIVLFLDLCDEYGLPHPETEVPYRGWRLDAFYRSARVAIELDDFGTHSRRDRFERDHDLAAELRRDGIQYQAFTYIQLTRRRRLVAETVATLLGAVLSPPHRP